MRCFYDFETKSKVDKTIIFQSNSTDILFGGLFYIIQFKWEYLHQTYAFKETRMFRSIVKRYVRKIAKRESSSHMRLLLLASLLNSKYITNTNKNNQREINRNN